MRERASGPEEIKDIVGKVIGEIAAKGPTKKQDIQNRWERLLDKKELKHTKIFEIKNDTLVVLVDSPVWLYQCNLKKKRLLTGMQKEYPEIQKLRFKIGKVK